MRTTISISPGELLDKITILRIKQTRITDPNKLKNIHHELRVLAKTHDAIKDDTRNPEIPVLTSQLQSVNEKIWDIEDNIRDCERRKDFGEAFIEFARGVYINNDERARLKRKINDLLESDLVEEKSYTEYQA